MIKICLIVYKPADKTVPVDELRTGFLCNDDGWGIMTRGEDGKPIIRKGIPTTDKTASFEEFLREWNKFQDKEVAVHFRFRTSGKIDLENAHPYQITEDSWIMHNGVLTIPEPNKAKSDTWHLADLIRPFAEKGLLRDPAMKQMLEKLCGLGNKLLIMDNEGFFIVNPGAGHYKDGIWYSNGSRTTYYGSAFGAWDNDEYSEWHSSHTFHLNQKRGSAEHKIYFSDGTSLPLDSFLKKPVKSAESSAQTFVDAEQKVLGVGSNSSSNAESSISTIVREIVAEEDGEYQPYVPMSVFEYIGMDLEKIKEVAYYDPDAVAEALYDSLQGTA